MKLLKKLKNRYNILAIVLASMFLILSFKLATLTIVRGEELRQKSDAKRVRELSITAPRGEIRDRYGRLLAGNKPSFTVQILKDEINNKNVDRNDIILQLVRILEKEGEKYTDDFPIKFNGFQFNEDFKGYYNSDSPEEFILDTLIEQNLVGELLQSYYEDTEGNSQFIVLAGEKARLVLLKEGIDLPITVSLNRDGEVEFQFDEENDIDKWKTENNVEMHLTPQNTIMNLISNDENILRKMLSDPVVRLLAYEVLDKKGMVYGIDLIPYSLKYDREYMLIKSELADSYSDITMNTTAKEDFIYLAYEKIGGDLFRRIFVQKDQEKKIIPANILISRLQEKGISVPVKVTIDEEIDEAIIEYESNEIKENFYNDEKLQDEKEPEEALLYLGQKHNLLKEIVTDDDIKFFVQKLILEAGVNPHISVSSWEYVPLKNKIDWFKKYNIPEDSSVEEAFNLLKEEYSIKRDINRYESRYVLVIIEQLNKQGYKAYEPINIAYGIEDETIARIEENNMDLKGIEISVEPVRYYPNGKTVSHILGYMGKISQSFEIQKYLIESDDYSPNDIIGKSGIEQKYEEQFNGIDGTKKVEVDAFGNTIKVLEETKVVPGDNLYLTIDAELQKVAEDALKHGLDEIRKGGEFKSKWGNYNYKESFEFANQGAVVALDVKTGEILAIANYPSYDPNLFATGISTADWESLKPEYEEEGLPLYNVAIKTAVQPGSTFKMITALAGLEKGLPPTETINDMGYIEYGNQQFRCWIWSYGGTHGPENVYDAIRDSCNYYFYSLVLGTNLRTGKDVSVKVDIEDIIDLGKKFGLDDKTGIEINGETIGRVPNPKTKIEQSKMSLSRYLKNNIKYYIKEDVTVDEEELNNKIEEISEWVQLDETLSRGQIIQRLNELGFNGLKKVEGMSINLVDMIKYTYLREAGWRPGDSLNVSIGQGDNRYTPIQMANYISILSNGGYRSKVSVVDKIMDYSNNEIRLESNRTSERISLKDFENLEHVKKGMLQVTQRGGTAYSIFKGFPVKVGAKTGTAERDGYNPNGGVFQGKEYDNYAWFVAFAPYDDPQIAVATVVFQGGHGGYAAPIAKEVIAQYLGLNSNNNEKVDFSNRLVR